MLRSLVYSLLVVQGMQELYLMTLVDDPTPSDRWRFINERYRIMVSKAKFFVLHCITLVTRNKYLYGTMGRK